MDPRPLWFSSALVALACIAGPVPARSAGATGAATAVATPTAPAPATAGPDNDAESSDQGDHARDAGVVDGEVVSVDYQRGMIGLMTPHRGRVDVFVLPSTNIQGKGDSFHTIADILRGARLRVFLSQRAGKFIAQIIHLR